MTLMLRCVRQSSVVFGNYTTRQVYHRTMSEFTVVRTDKGDVRGKKADSARGGSYLSFQGIPYAKPPVGQLRFQPPEPAAPWTGVKDALQTGPSCPSIHMITQQYIENSSEDCLYLNVYSANVNSNPKKAVMFWIHGGGFARGSGDSDVYGPDYLITEDVVVVTCNYRLGPFGFLSLQSPLCPGNNGLKDIVLALTWVQKNISNFGGDPSKVMIFGESAGGAAVNYMMLSPLSKGLFHAAISQSGSSINPWANSRKARIMGFGLGERLGFKTENEKELLDFLRKADVKDIVNKADGVGKKYDREEGHSSLPFVPTAEPEGTPGAFITRSPHQLVSEGALHDVPYMLGTVTLEGAIILVGQPDLATDEDYKKLIPGDIPLDRQSEAANQLASKIKGRYFKNGGYSRLSHMDACSHIYFTNGVIKTIENTLLSKQRKSPIYCYQFSYVGGKATLKPLLGLNDFPGTCHGDELGYLFHHNILGAKLEPNTTDYKIVETMTKLWSNFAKTGNPTSAGVEVNWQPATKSDKFYLDIGETLTPGKDLLKLETQFWDEIYENAKEQIKGKL